jgi:hypothetical protein
MNEKYKKIDNKPLMLIFVEIKSLSLSFGVK